MVKPEYYHEAIISPDAKTIAPLTYADSGVNIDKGDALVVDIARDAKRTKTAGAESALGGFGALFDLKAAQYKDPILVSATDGVGTKLELARITNIHRGLGIDLVAMCCNDVLAQGARPLFFLDYFATGKLEPELAKTVIAGIADGCIEAECALIGGETAEMPGLYPEGSYDLAGFCVGAVERQDLINPSRTEANDVAIAIASHGAHANGFSLIRKVLDRSQAPLDDKPPFDSPEDTLGQALLTPTAIYTKAFNAVMEATGGNLHGLAHITGGGLIENPPRAFRQGLSLDLDLSSWDLPPLFGWLKESGKIASHELARVFNCGIGMLIYVAESHANQAINALTSCGHEAWVAGRLKADDNHAVYLHGLEAWA